MATTDNGWPASQSLRLRPLVVNGIAFIPGIADHDDVETVLRYFWTEFDKRVEPLRNPGCWGFAYRENRNSPNSLSRHSGGIATDGNAPAHPNGVPTVNTFTASQIAEVHKILDELEGAVRWGGDYLGTPDAMHAEVDVDYSDRARLHATAERLRGEDMTPEDHAKIKAAIEAAVAPLAAEVVRLRTSLNTFRTNEHRRDVEEGRQLDRIEGKP